MNSRSNLMLSNDGGVVSGDNEEMKFKPSYPRYQSNSNYNKHQNNTNYQMYNSINKENNSNFQQYNMSKTGGKQSFQTHRVFNEDFLENDYSNNYSKK